MSGQPQIPGFMVLDVAGVYAAELDIEETVPELPVAPIFIVDPNTPFEVWAEVKLTGHIISLLNGTGWTIEYYLERMGPGDDIALGPKSGNWPTINHNDTIATLGKDVTKVKVEVTDAAKGLYKLTCVFNSGASDYVLGFAEGHMIQIAPNC
jgi:hypothetical protein